MIVTDIDKTLLFTNKSISDYIIVDMSPSTLSAENAVDMFSRTDKTKNTVHTSRWAYRATLSVWY